MLRYISSYIYLHADVVLINIGEIQGFAYTITTFTFAVQDAVDLDSVEMNYVQLVLSSLRRKKPLKDGAGDPCIQICLRQHIGNTVTWFLALSNPNERWPRILPPFPNAHDCFAKTCHNGFAREFGTCSKVRQVKLFATF